MLRELTFPGCMPPLSKGSDQGQGLAPRTVPFAHFSGISCPTRQCFMKQGVGDAPAAESPGIPVKMQIPGPLPGEAALY